jgi:hypothetical protein
LIVYRGHVAETNDLWSESQAELASGCFAEDAVPVGTGVALVSVFIGQVGVFGVELGISERGPGQPGSFVGEASGNGSRVTVEEGIGVAEDDESGRVEVENSGDGDIMRLSVGVFGTKLCVAEDSLPVAVELVSVGSGDEVTGVSKIGAVQRGLLMLIPSNGDQNLELNALKSEYWEQMIDDAGSSGRTWAQVP